MYKRLSRVRAVNIWLMAPLWGVAVFLVIFVAVLAPGAKAATTSSNLNFQARLLGTNGTVVPDGTYNIDFKLYNADSVTGTVGTCSGSCLWEETRKNSNSQGVQVINGYFSVNLGSVTAFPAINWDQQLWLTMNIGGTTTGASPTWDGEMQNAGHSIALTALPYSFIAGQLALTSGANRGTLSFGSVTNNPAITLPNASGTVCLQTSTACGFESTTGNDFIQNQIASLQQANFRIQSAATNKVAAEINGASGQTSDLFDVINGTTVFSVGANGQTLHKPTASNDSATFFQVQNASGNNVFAVDTVAGQVALGKASTLDGGITFYNGGGAHTVTLAAPNSDPASSFTLKLPSALPVSTQCLQSSSAGLLSFTTCVTSAAVNTIGTYSSSNHYTDGASITGSTLTLGSADATHPGLVDSSSQTFAGNKTFNGTVAVAAGGSSTTAFQVQDATASAWFNVNTTDGFVINNGVGILGNVLENPSFEASGTTDATGWYTPTASQVIATDAANAHSGNCELQITGNSLTHAVTTKYYAVHPGDTIYVEGYVKNSVGATGDAGLYLEFADKDKGGSTFTNSDTGLPGTSYLLKTFTVTIPANKFYVRIAASVKATATAGTFYFDDFYLKRVNEQAPLLITNVSTTALQVQNASSQTVLGVDSTNSKIFTTIPDSGTAIGFTFNTPSYTTAGAKLLSLQNNSAEKFYVDKDGNVNMSGGLSAGGDVSTTGNVNIGSGKVYKINGTQITSAALSNDSDLAKLAGTGPQTFSGNNKFTGTVLVQNANAAGFQVQNATNSIFTVDTSGNKVILGTASAVTGTIQFQGSGGPGTLTLTGPTTPDAGNFTLSIPAITANANICTDNSICANYASSSSLTSGLAGKLNKNAVDTSAASVTAVQGNLYAFTNNSNNIASGILKLDNGNNSGNALTVTGSFNYGAGNAYIVVNNTNATPSGFLIDLQANAASKFNVDASGNVTAAGNISIGSGKVYEINGTQITSAALSDGNTLAKLGANQTFSGNNTFSSASNSFTGDGSGLTNLNASNVATGTLNDGRLSSNVALLNRTGQTFSGDNTFAPTSANAGTTVRQTSGTATSGSVFDIQTADGLSHFLQVTNAAANEGNVTLQSVGATRSLTLGSSNGTLILTAATNTIQHSNSSLTIDVNNGADSTFIITNAQSGVVASLSVEGDAAVGAGRVYKVGTTSGSSITCSSNTFLQNGTTLGGITTGGSCANAVTSVTTPTTAQANGASISGNSLALSYADSNNPGIVSTGTQTFAGAKTVKVASTTAFQVQNASFNVMVVDTSNNHLKIYDGTATQAYVDIYYDDASSSAVIAASTGTTKIGNGTGDISLNAGAGSAVSISGHATSTWSLDSGNLTIDVTSASTPTLNLGTGAQAKNLVLGNTTGATSLTFKSGSGGSTFYGANSATAFQVQNSSNAAVLVVDTSNRQLKVMENAGSTNYSLIYYDTATSTANYTANSGTVAVGAGAGAITVTAGTSAAVNITSNAASTWKTTSGTLTLQSGTGTSDFLILNAGGSGQVQVNGSAVVKLGSASADPTCTNGAIYYNTTSTAFRGCQGGSWATLGVITPTLQTVYNSSTGGTAPEVKLNAGGTDTGAFDIQDADTSLGGVIFAVRGTNAGGLGTSLLNVDTSTNTVNIGTSGTSTALLVLGADTNSTFNQATLTNGASEINGAMFYSSTDHNFLCGVAGAWMTCNGLLYSNTAASSAVASCLTTACGAFSLNAPIPANYCQAGRVIHILAKGHFSVTGTPTLGMSVYYGTDGSVRTNNVKIGSDSPLPAAASGASNQMWALDFTIICFSTTAMNGQGTYTFQNSTTATTSLLTLNMLSTSNSTVSTSSAKNLYIFPQWSASSASNTATLDQLIVTGN